MLGNNVLALAGLVASAAAVAVPGQVNVNLPLLRRNETVVTTTKVVSQYTTFCPEPTSFTMGTKTYTVVEPTTLTITDCPCTIVEPCTTTNVAPTSTPIPPPPPPPITTLPPPPPPPPPVTTTPPTPPSPTPVSGAAENNKQYGFAGVLGAAIAGLLL